MSESVLPLQLVEVCFTDHPFGPFTYRVPGSLPLEGPGCRVRVPFGKRIRVGLAVTVAPGEDQPNYRDLISAVDGVPVLTQDLLDLTKWLSDYYVCSWGEAIAAAMPARLKPRSKPAYRLSEAAQAEPWLADEEGPSADLWRRLKAAPLTADQIRKRFPRGEEMFEQFRRRGWVEAVEVIARPVKPQSETVYRWCNSLPPADVTASLSKAASRQARIVALFENMAGPISGSTIRKSDAGSGPILKALVGKGWIEASQVPISHLGSAQAVLEETAESAATLTATQEQAIERIKAVLDKGEYHSFLLHGVTGSGKSLVYLEAVQAALDMGKSALVLTPEISLSPQLAGRLRRRFGDQVVISHSGLTPSERQEIWRRARSGQARVVVGARSAVFSPLVNLGLIVLDEEHDDSYKQEAPNPRYHVRAAAQFRASRSKAVVLLGSATPDVTTYHLAEKGRMELLQLPERHQGAPMPAVWVAKWGGFKEGALFSPQLRSRIEKRLERGEQTVLLINRRAFATIVMCSDCGEVATCPNCDISLRYHRVGLKLECHYCGYSQRVVDDCPKCRGRRLKYNGIGTQRVERELEIFFPTARVARMDLDTTRKTGSLQAILSGLAKREFDILLGTQMVAKGHDFPGVTLVGVLNADAELRQADFRAQERTFRLLVQASGRTGRAGVGEVVIQCIDPTHQLLRWVQSADYKALYKSEIAAREALGYPPFGRLIALTLKGPVQDGVAAAASAVKEKLLKSISQERLLGPVTPPAERLEGMYRQRFLIKLPSTGIAVSTATKQALRETVEEILKAFSKQNVQAMIDVDPVEA